MSILHLGFAPLTTVSAMYVLGLAGILLVSLDATKDTGDDSD